MKNYFKKLKQVSIGASPIVALILAVHFFISPMSDKLFVAFIISAVLLVAGQAFFLIGVDSSILTMGELVGSNIRKLKKLWLVLLFGLLFGTMATVAEPAVSVLANSVNKINPKINATLLTWVVSSGIGIFVAYGLLRVFKSLSIKWSFLISYGIAFILVLLSPPAFQAVAFDFSGATTGVITVPFILALGVGVSAVLGRKTQDDSYGLIGLASVGPIITMAIMGILFGGGSVGEFPVKTDPDFIGSLLGSVQNICIALIPITIVFFIFNFAFIKLPRKKVLQIVVGILVTIFGLTLFLTAINFGFSSAGRHIGEAFTDPTRAKWFKYLLIPFGLLLGFAITYTEVAIRVLATQVEQNTNGQIKKGTLIFTLAIGLALTVMFGMLRILFEINILYFLVPIFAIGLICMPFISRMFVGIGFDSGGVASGTVTAAFLVPLAIGASETLGGHDPMIYAFGMIAFIAAIPVVAISMLGLIYAYKLRKAKTVIDTKEITTAQKIHNYFICIITSPTAEARISEHLTKLNAKIVTSMSARGAANNPTNIFHLVDDKKQFMLAMISESNAVAMIDILDAEFEYGKVNTGIAFTIPIEHIEL